MYEGIIEELRAENTRATSQYLEANKRLVNNPIHYLPFSEAVFLTFIIIIIITIVMSFAGRVAASDDQSDPARRRGPDVQRDGYQCFP